MPEVVIRHASTMRPRPSHSGPCTPETCGSLPVERVEIDGVTVSFSDGEPLDPAALLAGWVMQQRQRRMGLVA